MVRGLELPPLLVRLLAQDRWRHPGDLKVREVVPWFRAPLVFLKTADGMSRESGSLDLFCRGEWLISVNWLACGRVTTSRVIAAMAATHFYMCFNGWDGVQSCMAGWCRAR